VVNQRLTSVYIADATTIMCKTEEGYFADFWASQRTMKLLKEYIARDPMLKKL
jgi:hypothetical protein